MSIYEYDLDNYSLDMLMVFLIGLVARILAYISLERKDRDKRV